MPKFLARFVVAAALLGAPALAQPASAPAAPPPAPAAPPAASWQVYKYPDLGFSVDLPAEPKRMDMNVPLGKDEKTGVDQGQAAMAILASNFSGKVYMVMHMDLTKATVDVANMDKLSDLAGAKAGDNAIISDQKVTGVGDAAHEMILAKDGKLMRMRLIRVGKIVYIVGVVAEAPATAIDTVKDAEANRFFNSFKLG